ncbi:hypothetical protein BAE44_0006239 [Dichanthelium oligosanthes]|uniref:Uncharacterized protein n=1 Tax=Dichanthelium oligosanthes TaxID=888268 RepID=A0A1E5W601_9POAL|nr:hypothetical protein BAE44_0006239 [Dichanthelium oligosanthes]
MDALLEQLSVLADMALDGGGFDPARLDGVLALFESEARASWAAAEAEHEGVARATEAVAGGHLNAVMGAAVGTYRGSSGEADALATATGAMEMALNATSGSESE